MNAQAAPTLASTEVNSLILALRSKQDPDRANAIARAPELGDRAVVALAHLLADPDNEVSRAGKRALQAIVRHAGRTGRLGDEAHRVESQLLIALPQLSAQQARREVVWMLSEIGEADSIKFLAALLTDPEVREDARCALQRIPGRGSLRALKTGLKQASEEFKPALAESLRKRGERIAGYPSQRLTPTKTTSVKPGGD